MNHTENRKIDDSSLSIQNDLAKNELLILMQLADNASSSEQDNGLVQQVESSVSSLTQHLNKNEIPIILKPSRKKRKRRNNTSSLAQGRHKFLNFTSLLTSSNEPNKFKIHEKCSNSCIKELEVNLDTFNKNPLQLPILNGWQRLACYASFKNNKIFINYISPCGRKLRTMIELNEYLRLTMSKLSIDMFSFNPFVFVNRQFEPNDPFGNIVEDIGEGKEKMPISLINCVDQTKPDNIEYCSQRSIMPSAAIETQAEGCDCLDDTCSNNCSCLLRTHEMHVLLADGDVRKRVGYLRGRLPSVVKTGVFECNDACKCSSKCANRVVQNGISTRLQVFKTENKGWGLRCLDDLAKGTFICTYSGQLMNEEEAELNASISGDRYLADLDFIESLKRLVDQIQDDDRRNLFIKKFNFDKYLHDHQLYVMDANQKGNIGRYLNHSCNPNVFVQNVFINTHDLRFPLIAFFTSSFIKAGEELCWDYNYTVDSVLNKTLYCLCGSDNCRQRLFHRISF